MTDTNAETYRFTDTDEAAVVAAVTGACAEWRTLGGKPSEQRDLPTLLRLGAHAVGMGLHQTLDAERAWIEDQARKAIAG